MGGTQSNTQKVRRFDQTYSLLERGDNVDLTFTHDGYDDASYSLRHMRRDHIISRWVIGPASKISQSFCCRTPDPNRHWLTGPTSRNTPITRTSA